MSWREFFELAGIVYTVVLGGVLLAAFAEWVRDQIALRRWRSTCPCDICQRRERLRRGRL